MLTFRSFGTFEFQQLFSEVEVVAATSQVAASQAAIAWLLMLGAITKSAQFPFHVWLPDTMETPTPVSALMHAGIVNAGGYLVIRVSPLFALAPESLLTLSLIGAFTAIFASVVMMTQSSVKRALAYSTIAQMGFMMLQCGLGAFSAAMLHIIAHSLYKAHAFLTSGSIVSQSRTTAGAALPVPSRTAATATLIGAAAATITTYIAILFALGVNLDDKPGGFVLAFILLLALTTWGWQLLTLGAPQGNVHRTGGDRRTLSGLRRELFPGRSPVAADDSDNRILGGVEIRARRNCGGVLAPVHLAHLVEPKRSAGVAGAAPCSRRQWVLHRRLVSARLRFNSEVVMTESSNSSHSQAITSNSSMKGNISDVCTKHSNPASKRFMRANSR